MEDNITSEQQIIKDLEAKVFNLELDKTNLLLANAKLGYSTRLLSEFHLSQDDKTRVANSVDLAENANDVKKIYDEFFKMLNNSKLGDESADFQMSEDFKSNVRAYAAVAIGYDPVTEIAKNIATLTDYFNLENKIGNTPNAGVRQPMVDKLMEKRPLTTEALDNIVDIITKFNTEDS